MKYIVFLIGIFSSHTLSLANSFSFMNPGSAVPLASAASSKRIFINYPGELSNQCGLRLVTTSRNGYISEQLNSNLEVSIHDELLVEKPIPYTYIYDFSSYVQEQLYGIIVTISTKDGSPLENEYQDILAVSVPCKL